jgi:hypothetical protein
MYSQIKISQKVLQQCDSIRLCCVARLHRWFDIKFFVSLILLLFYNAKQVRVKLLCFSTVSDLSVILKGNFNSRFKLCISG